MADGILTQARLKELLHYDPDTGVFTNIKARKKVRVGTIAGNVGNRGYGRIRVEGKSYLSHRLAWLYVHGTFPPDQIDHINRNRADNRLCNLRLATNAENHQNQSVRSDSTSGHVGVNWFKPIQRWMVRIHANHKQIHIGYFSDLSEAIAARKAAEIKYHQFQNGNPATELRPVFN